MTPPVHPASPDFGLIVIGGGLAGVAAAVRAAELGVSALVLEAGPADDYPCNSRMAMGFLNVAFHDIGLPPAALRSAIDRATGGQADPALADVLAHEAAPALAWLRALGMRTIVGNWRPGSATMLAPPAAIAPGRSTRGRGPDRMLRLLTARLVARGGAMLHSACVRRLVMDAGTCVGVVAEVDGKPAQFDADAVVIADGGFAGDAELVARHVSRGPLLQRNAGTARGDGLRMAVAVGARVTGLRGFYGHVQSADAVANRRLWPYPTCDHLCGAGIVVDARGVRVADEGRSGVWLANRIAALPDPAGAVAIFDHLAWMTRGTAFPLPANPLLATGGATIHSAGTLPELAVVIGLPAAALTDTIAAYNAAVVSGTGERLTPPRSSDVHAPASVATPPFHAVRLIAGMTYTTGGIAIDDRCRVRADAGGVIPGLYAAGSATGGHEGGDHAGYTGGLAKALVFGKRAGETVAHECRRDMPAHLIRTIA